MFSVTQIRDCWPPNEAVLEGIKGMLKPAFFPRRIGDQDFDSQHLISSLRLREIKTLASTEDNRFFRIMCKISISSKKSLQFSSPAGRHQLSSAGDLKAGLT